MPCFVLGAPGLWSFLMLDTQDSCSPLAGEILWFMSSLPVHAVRIIRSTMSNHRPAEASKLPGYRTKSFRSGQSLGAFPLILAVERAVSGPQVGLRTQVEQPAQFG